MDIVALSKKLKYRLAQPLPGKDVQRIMMTRPQRPVVWPNHHSFTPAAVLILFFPTQNGIHFFLTERTEHVQHHKGQVSLPGGAWEPGESLEATALRETREEMGIPESEITLVGALSTLPVPITGFTIHPFVGIASHEPMTQHAREEVARIIKVPLDALLDDHRVKTEDRVFRDTPFQVPYFHFDTVKVWGATSMILSELKQVLKECL